MMQQYIGKIIVYAYEKGLSMRMLKHRERGKVKLLCQMP